MGKSLQEQLLKSGLAKPKQAAKARREKIADNQAARRQGRAQNGEQVLAGEIAAAQAAKRERDQKLNTQRNAQRAAREQDQAVAQIIEQHRVAAGGQGEDIAPYNYSIDNRVHKIAVSHDQRRMLADGRLAVVRHRGRASLVPQAAAQRLMATIPGQVWLVSGEDDKPDADDPYAAYPVPDDLMW